MAAVRVVFPWSMCPIVPTFMFIFADAAAADAKNRCHCCKQVNDDWNNISKPTWFVRFWPRRRLGRFESKRGTSPRPIKVIGKLDIQGKQWKRTNEGWTESWLEYRTHWKWRIKNWFILVSKYNNYCIFNFIIKTLADKIYEVVTNDFDTNTIRSLLLQHYIYAQTLWWEKYQNKNKKKSSIMWIPVVRITINLMESLFIDMVLLLIHILQGNFINQGDIVLSLFFTFHCLSSYICW